MKTDIKNYQKKKKLSKVIAIRLSLEDFNFVRKHNLDLRLIVEEKLKEVEKK